MAKLILYQAKSPYAGDITKNCALTGKEVDNNFLNLKGEDIEKIYLDEETKKLTFTRFRDGLKNCNGEPIDAKTEIDLTELEYVTGYKYEDGVIKITYSNGKTAEMSMEAFGLTVATDSTINGNGSKGNPLTISQAYRTGQYKPVKGIIDMTEGEKLPEEGVIDGDGYITKEVKSDFGMFYTSDQALMLEGLLRMEKSEWRVPTKKDWDTLLNYLEDCDKYKNHSLRSETDTDARGMRLGNLAGFKVKSLNTEGADYWRNPASNGGVLRMYPTGSFSALSGAYSGFGEHAHFWTLTEGDVSCRNFYSKKFIDDRGTVMQIEAMPAQKLTIRLVKNFIGDNYHQFEEIHGRMYETKLFASDGDECNQVWTMVNVDISEPGMDLLPTPMPEEATSAITVENAYYINRWNGRELEKAEMVEGDCVVVLDEDCEKMSEYRLQCGELKNMDDFWQNQIDELVSAVSESSEEIRGQIDELSGATQELRSDLEDEISARTAADEYLQEEIDTEETARIEEDEKLWHALNETADTLNNMITAETQAREEADELLHQEIEDEASARTESDREIKDSIGLPSDVPTKAAVEYTDDDFKNGNITVFGFINASNDYGYNLEEETGE
jgi:uncharacterized protein (TIGR02145 family)